MYMKKYIVECIGTFVLTFFGCATAMFVGCGTPAGLFATAAAFGLTVCHGKTLSATGSDS